MRKEYRILWRLSLWAWTLYMGYNVVCISRVLTKYKFGMVNDEGVFFNKWQMSFVYLVFAACYSVFVWVILKFIIWIKIVIHDEQTDWPKDFEKKFLPREFVYVMVITMTLIATCLESKILCNTVMYVVLLVVLLIERILFSFIHKPEGIKLSRRARRAKVKAAMKKKLNDILSDERNSRVKDNVNSSFRNLADDPTSGEGYDPNRQKRKLKPKKGEAEEPLDERAGRTLVRADEAMRESGHELDEDTYDGLIVTRQAEQKAANGEVNWDALLFGGQG